MRVAPVRSVPHHQLNASMQATSPRARRDRVVGQFAEHPIFDGIETDARAAGIDLDVLYTDTSGRYSNYRIGETSAAVKILIDRANDTIVGAHMYGPGYGELLNYCALAIRLGLTTRQLRSMNPVYPSVTGDLGSML